MTALPLDNSTNFEAVETLSDLNSNYTTEPALFDSVARQIASALNVYYTPILISLGAIGNLVSVFVFYRSKLRLQSTSQYLSALAVSDTIFLLQLLPPWLNAVHITGLFHQEGFCQIFIYISYVTCSFSAWLVVAFTIERFVAVLYPLHRNMVCTVKRARYVIGGIAIGSLLLNIPVLRFAIPTPDDCNIDYEYLAHAARFNMVDTVISFTVPLAAIIVLNVWIMVGVWRIERARGELMRTDHLAALGSHAFLARQIGCPRSQQRVTRMLLIVSSVFVCLNLPAYTMRVIAYAYGMNQDEYSGRWEALQQVALMFFYTNFGINFILYCLSGQNFRRALKLNLPRFRRHARHSITIRRRTTSSHPGRTGSVSNKKWGFTERYAFNKSEPKQGESLAEWAARIRHSAQHCKFKSELNVVIRDKFVVGLDNEKERERLLMDDPDTVFRPSFEVGAVGEVGTHVGRYSERRGIMRKALRTASPPRAPLDPWPLPAGPWERVHLDVLYVHFLVIIDAYSKWLECFYLKNNIGSEMILSKLSEVMGCFGLMQTLVTDIATNFTSTIFKKFCDSNGIKHITITPYHPASNGQAENSIKIV